MFYPTYQDQINAHLEFMGRGLSNKEIARIIIDEWRTGNKAQILKDMADADEYYMCRNTAIQNKNRNYIDSKGNVQVNNTLSNAKIASAFVRANVQQKVNYAVGKPFLINIEGPIPDETDNKTGKIQTDPLKEQYLDEWNQFITPEVRKIIKQMTTAGVNKGIGWAYVTIIDGQLQIVYTQSQQTYPAWADEAHTELDAIIRDYIIISFTNGYREEINKVEFWDKNVVEKYVYKSGSLDPDEEPISPHLKAPDGKGISWGRVPFIALKGNEDELPVLNIIRQQVDNYDALQSKSVDALLDDVDPILVFEGYTPELGELIEQRKMAKNSRVAGTEGAGKLYYVQVKPDITAAQTQLESLKKDIREFGQAVDTQDIRFGNNPSGVALKSMYQDLDIYINGLETEFETFMQNLKYFFDIWLEFKGVGSAQQWSQYKLIVTFNRDMLINSTADIQETVMLASTGTSQYTQDLWNPAVESPEIEQSRREAEQERLLNDTRIDRQFAELHEKSRKEEQERSRKKEQGKRRSD